MSYYFEHEMRMIDFRDGVHSLKEGMEFGFNLLYILDENKYEVAEFWNGCDITPELKKLIDENADYESDSGDGDQDGYMYLRIRKFRRD